MSQPRTIRNYFKRPAFSQTSKYIQPSSSPLSDPPSDLPSQYASSQQFPEPELEPEPKVTAGGSSDGLNSAQPKPSNNGTLRRSSSLGTSFNSSQRIVKNGQEVVIDSEGESISSIESLETSDEILNKFLGFSSQKRVPEPQVNKPDTSSKKPPNRKKPTFRNFRAISEFQGNKYKFSMESLVTRAVDDDEAEASVAKAKALLEGHDKSTLALRNGSEPEGAAPGIREDVLASALSTDDQENNFQRLLDAVKRTEALEQEKSWSFFIDDFKQEISDFPKDSIVPSSREAFLREPTTRDRAFHSGILDFAFSKQRLPDEVFIWIFHSVPSEPRDELRYAYCRAIKHAERRRIESLVGPEDIDQVFLNLGGSSTAVHISDPIQPQTSYNPENSSRNWNCLLSVLDLLGVIANQLRVDTKDRALCVLFRLALDTGVSNNSLVIAALESTIDSLLQSIPRERFEQTIQPTSRSTFNVIKDPTLQSRLMGHILPTNSRIALFRCRLAMAFLSNNESQLEKSDEEILNLKQIINLLKDTRLEAKLHKARLEGDYDYTELKAITSLLNVVIDTGRTTLKFPDKATERQFNDDVDALAEQVKRIFSAIEDSGASHLRRTEAKQGLEALRYRIIYSIRSRQRLKSVFSQDDWKGHSSEQMGAFFKKTVKQKGVIKAGGP